MVGQSGTDRPAPRLVTKPPTQIKSKAVAAVAEERKTPYLVVASAAIFLFGYWLFTRREHDYVDLI